MSLDLFTKLDADVSGYLDVVSPIKLFPPRRTSSHAEFELILLRCTCM